MISRRDDDKLPAVDFVRGRGRIPRERHHGLVQQLAGRLVESRDPGISLVHPREVFRAAIAEAAASVIVVHNHPSGDPAPSRADVEATRRLAAALAPLAVALHDHLVFAGGDFRSFRELGLL